MKPQFETIFLTILQKIDDKTIQIEKQDSEYVIFKPIKTGLKQNIAKVMIDDENEKAVNATIFVWNNAENRFNGFATTVPGWKTNGDLTYEEILDFVYKIKQKYIIQVKKNKLQTATLQNSKLTNIEQNVLSELNTNIHQNAK